jgi:hypothetical protein
MKTLKCILACFGLLLALNSAAGDEAASTIDSRYIGTWNGNWLEGMSSGKIRLEIKEAGGDLSFTALPSFGIQPTQLRKVTSDDKRLAFLTTGADGKTMRFELKPSEDFKILKGKAHYESLHMELELTRAVVLAATYSRR